MVLLCCAGMISWGSLGTDGGFTYGISLLCRNDKLEIIGNLCKVNTWYNSVVQE